MDIVLFHNGSMLGNHIMESWRKKYSQTSNLHLVDDVSLDCLEQASPNLVILASDEFNEFETVVVNRCRERKLTTLSVLGRGSTVLLGPLETPEVPGCITCLELRWENTFERSVLSYIFSQDAGPSAEPLEMSPNDLVKLADIVTDEIRSILSNDLAAPNTRGKVGVYEQAEEVAWVPVVPSHDCPRCNLRPDDNPDDARVQFSSHSITDVETLRVRTLDFKRLEELYVHTKVGYISAANEYQNEDGYVQADAYIYTPSGAEIAGYGAGLSSVDAKQSAILEVLERSCGFQSVRRRPVVFGKYSDFHTVALHPAQFGLHSDELYQSLNTVLQPFTDDQEYSWVWAYSTKDDKSVLIPEQIAYYGLTTDVSRFVKESSNGCAIGGTLEEAVLHGIFEVLERDGLLNMWYGKMPAPQVKLGIRCPSKVSQLIHDFTADGFAVRLFDISHDLTIPTICAVGINNQNEFPKVVCGTACHLNPYEAVYGALRELAVQVHNLKRAPDERRKEALSMFLDSKKIREILHHVAVTALPESYPRWTFLLRQRNQEQVKSIEEIYSTVAGRYQIDSGDIRKILGAVLDDLHQRGFDVIVVNQTSAEVSHGGLFAVKVLIPGMTPITFGYLMRRVQGLTRLFELPHRMGYSPRMLTEQDLNENCHPLS